MIGAANFLLSNASYVNLIYSSVNANLCLPIYFSIVAKNVSDPYSLNATYYVISTKSLNGIYLIIFYIFIKTYIIFLLSISFQIITIKWYL